MHFKYTLIDKVIFFNNYKCTTIKNFNFKHEGNYCKTSNTLLVVDVQILLQTVKIKYKYKFVRMRVKIET